MAIALRAVGATNPTTSGTAGVTWNSAGTVSFTKPAGLVNGDVLVLTLGASAALTAVGLPTGWVQLLAPISPSAGTKIYAAYKVIASAGTEPATYAFTNNSGILATLFGGAIVAYSGVDNTTPSDATPVTSSWPTNTTAITQPSITTATANALILGLMMPNNAVTISSAAVTVRWNLSSATTAGSAFGDVAGPASPGASGTKAWTLGAKTSGNAASFALRPAGGPATWNGVADIQADFTGIAADGTVTTFDFPAISPMLQTRIPS